MSADRGGVHIDLLTTTDPVEWTNQFCALFRVVGQDGEDGEKWQWGLMVSWFSNAMETARNGGDGSRTAERFAYLFGCMFRMAENGNGTAARMLAEYRAHFDDGDIL